MKTIRGIVLFILWCVANCYGQNVNDPSLVSAETIIVHSTPMSNTGSETFTLMVFDVNMIELTRQNFICMVWINAAFFSEGMYFYEIFNGKGIVKKGKFVRHE